MLILLLPLMFLSGCAQPSERCSDQKTCVPYIKFANDGSRIDSYWNRCLEAEVDISQCSSVEIK